MRDPARPSIFERTAALLRLSTISAEAEERTDQLTPNSHTGWTDESQRRCHVVALGITTEM
jgi:hypothetical protein